jgi:hypothetical protein
MRPAGDSNDGERRVEQSAEIERAVGLIEGAIAGLGVDAETVRVEAPPGNLRAWSLRRGSAGVAVFIRTPKDGEPSPWLRVAAPIVVADPANELALYKKLLELNARGLGAVEFGALDGRVMVVAERRTVDLEPTEVGWLIERVGVVADHYDDTLIERFGGQKVGG